MNPAQTYDQILVDIAAKNYQAALIGTQALKQYLQDKGEWVTDRRPPLDMSKYPELIQTVDSPAGPLWIWIRGMNHLIRELPAEEIKS